MKEVIGLMSMPLGTILLIVFLVFFVFSVGAKLLTDFISGLFKRKK